MAVCPSRQHATTSMSGSACRAAASASRIRSWSSTTITRITTAAREPAGRQVERSGPVPRSSPSRRRDRHLHRQPPLAPTRRRGQWSGRQRQSTGARRSCLSQLGPRRARYCGGLNEGICVPGRSYTGTGPTRAQEGGSCARVGVSGRPTPRMRRRLCPARRPPHRVESIPAGPPRRGPHHSQEGKPCTRVEGQAGRFVSLGGCASVSSPPNRGCGTHHPVPRAGRAASLLRA